MKIIGLDIGEKRIGVAKVDSTTRIAVPVGYILADGSEWQEIARVANLNNTNFFVLGLPRSNEGNETAQTLYVRQFARTLIEKVPEAKIRFQDESLTSVEAEERLKKRQKKYEKGDIDAEAATIILQDFIENFQQVAGATERGAPEIAGTPEKAPGGGTIEKGAPDFAESALNLAHHEGEKIALNAKKAKHKSKKLIGWVAIPLVIIAIIAGGVGAALAIKEQRARERAEEYAKQEAEMVADVFDFTIIPGETIFEVKEDLAELGYDVAEIEAAFAADYDFDFLKERPDGASLEGYLYGETYEFYADSSVAEILTRFLSGMDTVIKENNLREAYAEQGLTLYEGITLASLVQQEIGVPSEQPTVAQVFLSRLELGWALGSDASVTYALDVVDPAREYYTDNAAALTIDSCYNTRLYAGLPCGPIGSPSLSALVAVAHPTDTAYLFFLTGDDGLMYYSYTESEHLQNAATYCQTLCNLSL